MRYTSITVLIGISVAGSLLGNFIDSKYIGLLGLFPIYLGLKQLVTLFKTDKKDNPQEEEKEIKSAKSGILKVATVTFANGGDNIGVYVPLFATLTSIDKSIMISVFLIMVSVWLIIAKYLTTHPILAKVLSKYGHIITPVVLCL